MDVQLSERQVELIKRIAEEEGFTDFEVKTQSGSSKGDNYLGVITTVSIKNHKKTLELILKSAIGGEELRKRAPIRNVFMREIFIYTTIFPEFKKFGKEEGLREGFSGHAKLYGSSDEDLAEFLIFENMKAAGFELWNRKVPMTEDHVELVFKEYGKFHAMSFAMNEKRPELYKELCSDMKRVFEDVGTPEQTTAMVKQVLQNGFNAVKGDKLATEALERFSLEAEKFIVDELKIPDEHSVILHGDCWCNNMLFKYEDEEKQKPTEVCLIDWQISWIGSPVLDLSYYLFTCAPKRIICDINRYLKIYHDSLSDTLRKLHCDPGTVFPFELLEEHWKKYAKYGVYISLFLVKLMLSDGNEVPDMADMSDSKKSLMDVMTFETVHNDILNQRLSDIVTVSAENNWI